MYWKSGGGSADTIRASVDGGQGESGDWTSPFFPANQVWHHWEGYVYCGTSGNTNGFLRSVIDGRQRTNWTGWGLINSSQPHSYNYWRFGHVSGSNSAGGSILLSDVYIDNTQAHVFISNASSISNYLSRGSFAVNETQVCNSWSASSITFTFNQGSFSSGAQAYLYVVDSSGGINATGYPIRIGGGTTGGAPPPIPTITDLDVVQ